MIILHISRLAQLSNPIPSARITHHIETMILLLLQFANPWVLRWKIRSYNRTNLSSVSSKLTWWFSGSLICNEYVRQLSWMNHLEMNHLAWRVQELFPFMKLLHWAIYRKPPNSSWCQFVEVQKDSSSPHPM